MWPHASPCSLWQGNPDSHETTPGVSWGPEMQIRHSFPPSPSSARDLTTKTKVGLCTISKNTYLQNDMAILM